MNTLQLGDVEETALIPLAVRADESKRPNHRISDPKAVEIMDTLKIDPKNLDKLITHECVVARTIMFDYTTKRYLEKYPDAVCINMGCGLDNRFARVDNQKASWYNVDLPDAIDVRKKLYSETEREHMIAKSLLEPSWADAIPTSKHVIVVAEGLFMYFQKDEVKAILDSLTSRFKTGHLIVELMSPITMKEKLHDTVRHTNASFGWGTKNGHELEVLNPHFTLISEDSFSKQMFKSTFISKLLGLLVYKVNNRIAVFEWK